MDGSLWLNVLALVLQGVVLGGILHLFLFNLKLLELGGVWYMFAELTGCLSPWPHGVSSLQSDSYLAPTPLLS